MNEKKVLNVFAPTALDRTSCILLSLKTFVSRREFQTVCAGAMQITLVCPTAGKVNESHKGTKGTFTLCLTRKKPDGTILVILT